MSDLLEELGRKEREAQKIPDEWRAFAEGRATEAQIRELRRRAELDPEAAILWERFRPLDRDAELAKLLLQQTPKKKPSRVYLLLPIAAGLAFAVFLFPRDTTIPKYAIEANVADLEIRGSTAGHAIPIHHQDSALNLILRPESTVHADLVVETFYEHAGRKERWNVPLDVADSGAIRIQGRIADLFPKLTGDVTLIFVLANEDGEETQRLTHHLRIVAEP